MLLMEQPMTKRRMRLQREMCVLKRMVSDRSTDMVLEERVPIDTELLGQRERKKERFKIVI